MMVYINSIWLCAQLISFTVFLITALELIIDYVSMTGEHRTPCHLIPVVVEVHRMNLDSDEARL